MARIRTIKPELCTSQSVARLSRPARLFFVLLLTEADDEGRFVDAPRRLAGALFPWDDDVDAHDVDGWLKEMAAEEIIVRYSTPAGDFAAFGNWLAHQKVQHPAPSRFPTPPSCIPHETLMKSSGQEVGSRKLEVGSSFSCVAVAEAALAPAAPPQARKRAGPRATHPPPDDGDDGLFGVLLRACDMRFTELTPSARGSANRALAELRSVGADGDELQARARRYRQRWPDMELTPTALAKHWASLANDRASAAGVVDVLAGIHEFRRLRSIDRGAS